MASAVLDGASVNADQATGVGSVVQAFQTQILCLLL